jgi:hypothetical protein
MAAPRKMLQAAATDRQTDSLVCVCVCVRVGELCWLNLNFTA